MSTSGYIGLNLHIGTMPDLCKMKLNPINWTELRLLYIPSFVNDNCIIKWIYEKKYIFNDNWKLNTNSNIVTLTINIIY